MKEFASAVQQFNTLRYVAARSASSATSCVHERTTATTQSLTTVIGRKSVRLALFSPPKCAWETTNCAIIYRAT